MSPYRLCVVFVYDIASLLPAHQDTFASAFLLNISKELAEQSLKQQIFTSWCELLQHRLSRKWLRYIEYHLTTAILSQLPRFVCETLCCFRQLDKLSYVAAFNGDDRNVVEVLDQQAHLRRVMQLPLNLTAHAQVRVTE
ncbi:hypothetical protein MRX96_046597 [Rhipicephalus microplus]